MLRTAALLLGAALLAACGSGPTPTSTITHAPPPADLGGHGTFKVGLDMSDAAMVRLDPTTLEPYGIADDLERRLGRVSGYTTTTIRYASTALILTGLARTEFDVAFLPVAEVRAAGGQVTPPIVEVEQTYLVPGTSPIQTIADVDTAGRRVAVETASPADDSLAATLKNAKVVKADTDTDTFALLTNGTADAMAGSRASLTILAAGLPGSRVLTGSFATIPYGVAIPPPSRPDAVTYLDTFAAGAASTVKNSIADFSLRGVTPG